MKTVAALVGSLRKESSNRKLAHALGQAAEGRLAFFYPDLGQLPMYNEDLWDNPPDAVWSLKKQIEKADALLLITPEYNRAPTPIITNAIAWGSRPWGENSFKGKPTALAGISPGPVGTAHAQALLKPMMPVLDMVLFGMPELYLQEKDDFFGDDGGFGNERTRDFISGWVDKFSAFIDRHGSADS